MKLRVLVAGAAALAFLLPAAAGAATVVNGDKTTHTIIITPKTGKAHHLALSGHHSRKVTCTDGTMLMLGKSSIACSATTAKITIKGGKLSSL